jgi:hypothetical protein
MLLIAFQYFCSTLSLVDSMNVVEYEIFVPLIQHLLAQTWKFMVFFQITFGIWKTI